MSRRRTVCFSAVILTMATCYLGWNLYQSTPIKPHRGDGEFQDLTRRIGPLAVLRGWSIKLPPFDLGITQHEEYRLAGLTKTRSRLGCGVYFAVPDSTLMGRDFNAEQLAAKVRLQLVDSEGNPVVDVDGRLGSYTWWGHSRRGFSALYDLDKSFFVPDESEEYRLRVWYSPDPRLAGFEGFVYLQSGGQK